MKKKCVLFGLVFLLLAAAVFLGGCGDDPQKIKPAERAPGGGVNIIENGGAAEALPDVVLPGADKDAENRERLNAILPKVEVVEGYIRNAGTEWTAAFDKGEVLDALKASGASVATVGSIEVAQRNEFDCATTISVGGKIISAFDFKEALGLKSTLITDIRKEEGEYIFTGRGEN